jgi:hypothetical protein
MTDQRINDFAAGPGGVMTDEVGVVTGDLTLKTTVDPDGSVVQLVQYQQAAEWYRVSEAPARVPSGQSIDTVHSTTLARLKRGQN